MVKRTYKKLDALSCEVSETSTAKKNFNVSGILAKKKELEAQLVLVNEVIAEMKKAGCVFEAINKK